jgi:GAF domain-containing protein
VVGGTVVGLVPFLAIQVTNLTGQLLGTPLNLQPFFAPANLATTAIPLSFGYAIIKHRVFDITVVVRRGLQDLLAKNALRALLLLPAAGLAYGLLAHRQEPMGRLLLTNSPYVYLIVAALLSLRFHARLTRWLDRRFFREAYDRERLLLRLIEDLDTLESASSVSKLVSHELEAAFHPACLFVWHREAERPALALSYSSGGYLHSTELGASSPLRELALGATGVIELPLAHADRLPMADRAWLEESRVRLLVPIKSDNRELLGLLMLGDKKSEEPYSGEDLKLLQAIARQIAVGRENLRLKERVHEDRRIRHDVLAQLETGLVSLVRECPSCGTCYDADESRCPTDGAELQLSLPVERTIDRKYRLERLIGRGGMGAVYEAADLRLGRRVAIKILVGRGFGDHDALRRFEREAHACASLAHPNIVTVFDYGGAGARAPTSRPARARVSCRVRDARQGIRRCGAAQPGSRLRRRR